MLEYERVIQAFSRTNRVFGPEKPFGVIRYYRMPHTMEANIAQAVRLYAGESPLELFVPKLGANLADMNALFSLPAREQIGRAKYVSAEEYEEAYQKIDAQMTDEIAKAIAAGGEEL